MTYDRPRSHRTGLPTLPRISMPAESVSGIQPTLNFIPPNYTPWVLRLARWLIPRLIRQNGIAQLHTENAATLAQLFQDFQAGNVRLILAFRHPSTNDPLVMSHLLWEAVPRAARDRGIPLRDTVHTHFIYDRGIPLWAGESVAWFFSKLGGTSMQRGKLDRPGLKSARDLLLNGRFPLAAAPEGATNSHSEIVSPLEPGVAQMAFWTVEDLRSAGRSERVAIVPIGIQYAYLSPPWTKIDAMIAEIETSLGLQNPVDTGAIATTADPDQRYLRLYLLGDRLLDLVETFYQEFYNQTLPVVDTADPNQRIGERLKNLLDRALQVSEAYFGVTSSGSVEERCRRIEQAGWDRIYRDDGRSLCSVERGLANWVAAEATSRMNHMRLVERFTAVTGHYVREKPTAERFAETLIILWRVTTWIQGGDATKLPHLGKQQVWLRVGEPIWVSDRAADYKANRRAAVSGVTQDLQTALKNLIV